MFAELRRRVASLQTQLTIAKERAERAEADCAALREENDIQRASIQQLSRMVEEAQADNAALREALEMIANSGKEEKFNWCIEHKCHLGAANDSPILLIYRIAKQALSSPHPGAELLERVNMLEAERDAAIEDIERLCTTYYEHADDYDLLVNTCGEYCVHENKNLCFEADASEIYRCVNFKWRGLTQAKEGRP